MGGVESRTNRRHGGKRRVRARKVWSVRSCALGMVGDEWHGPTPPGEGWSEIKPGPRGGKRWRKGAGGGVGKPDESGVVKTKIGEVAPTGNRPQPPPLPAMPSRQPPITRPPVSEQLAAYTVADAAIAAGQVEYAKYSADKDRVYELFEQIKVEGVIPKQFRMMDELDRIKKKVRVAEVIANSEMRAVLGVDNPTTMLHQVVDNVVAGVKMSLKQRKSVTDGVNYFRSLVPTSPETTITTVFVPINAGRSQYNGQYNGVEGVISLDSEAGGSTVAHEMGHHFEEVVPGVHSACAEFLAYRVGDEPLTKLSEKFPRSGWDDGDTGRKDQFDRVFPEQYAYYIGKHYDDATEVLSMGVEKLMTDPARFAALDPEYFKFVVGVLRGDIRGPT